MAPSEGGVDRREMKRVNKVNVIGRKCSFDVEEMVSVETKEESLSSQAEVVFDSWTPGKGGHCVPGKKVPAFFI